MNLKFVLNSKANSGGKEYLVMLYMYQRGERPRYAGTDVSVEKKFFNEKGTTAKQNWIRASHPAASQLNELLAGKMEKAVKLLTEMEKQDHRITTQEFAQLYKDGGSQDDFILHLERQVKDLTENKRLNRAMSVRSVKVHLQEMAGTIQIRSITPEFLTRFEHYLYDKGLSSGSVRTYLDTLKAQYNRYHKLRKIKPVNNPFEFWTHSRRYEQSKFPDEAARNEIQLLLSYQPSPGTETHALETFLLLFFLEGMRFADLITLRNMNVVVQGPGQPVFVRIQIRKTGNFRFVQVPAPVVHIFYKYMNRLAGPEEYFFPFILEAGHKYRKINVSGLSAEMVEFLRLRICNTQYNRCMAAITARLGITKKLTMHTARHSFASQLYDATLDVRLVQGALSHGDIRTTQNYLAKRNHLLGIKSKQVYDVFELPEEPAVKLLENSLKESRNDTKQDDSDNHKKSGTGPL